uniref:C-type lectin domain-containing protein n=1 Tax=Pseudictyota dubia TaxID=2749911 RepID=A0A7R9VQF3_9STRA|mmetsp:Transcript_20956/g.39276  ORF Transcript_20956/g.39276 Transcript_20956/m.39276 type:complete len:363 (+) Transcript_20956:273-1361(+)|eukprot:CAMPEP_0197454676 /NCGR_PEP_ID=MMETSP1175-20131217/38604_1 /TAXON_ID=1003142 /ORGANISM="Triceratium dubium, Strain CCMP147" /LENGTH=362 /DNA_ID=CAMNT_0042988321 /DNA_START=226 /DNA_END=1314 /DNA_ORIENTATION=-
MLRSSFLLPLLALVASTTSSVDAAQLRGGGQDTDNSNSNSVRNLQSQYCLSRIPEGRYYIKTIDSIDSYMWMNVDRNGDYQPGKDRRVISYHTTGMTWPLGDNFEFRVWHVNKNNRDDEIKIKNVGRGHWVNTKDIGPKGRVVRGLDTDNTWRLHAVDDGTRTGNCEYYMSTKANGSRKWLVMGHGSNTMEWNNGLQVQNSDNNKLRVYFQRAKCTYWLTNGYYHYWDAVKYCNNQGAEIASITTDKDWEDVQQVAVIATCNGYCGGAAEVSSCPWYWLGAAETVIHESGWAWDDGTDWTYVPPVGFFEVNNDPATQVSLAGWGPASAACPHPNGSTDARDASGWHDVNKGWKMRAVCMTIT